MQKSLSLNAILAIGLFSFCSSISHAHAVWLEKANQPNYPFVVKFGHEETETYPEHKLKRIQAVNTHGQLVSLTPHFIKGEAYIAQPQGSVVLLEFDNGIWSQQSNGKFVEKSRADDASLKKSTHHLKLGKNILQWDDAALNNYHQNYELIPLNKPEVGKTLSLRVLHQDKALSGINVTDGTSTQQSNAEGIVAFEVKSGSNHWLAVFEEPSSSPQEYDKTKIEYLFSFEMP